MCTPINYEEGRKARKGYVVSQHYAGLSNNITPDTAMKIFLPPIINDKMEIQRPLPKDRKEWVRGWNDEVAEELNKEK